MSTSEDRDSWPTGRLVSTAARLIEQAWNARLREHDVTHAGLIVLHLLDRGAASQRQLADAQSLTEQTIGRTLSHLESTGHVRRATDPVDRRRRIVALTAGGTALLAAMTHTGDLLTDEILATVSVDLIEFRKGLRAVIDQLGPAEVWHGRQASAG